ncbi:alpha/beta fold hydrolase [Phenylobacterium sp. LjRoot219]|uniref:alpha/beta fold hydrolase n=1 Tax=Phenylobacterium sp. LjRoot219 TaxID=3342283 RepID=UPI003ECDA508
MRFVLIHGGFHGAWCWSRTIPELARLGHQALAIDLPGHGERRDERSTLADRQGAILEVLQPGDVLVGHSGGGYDISLAAGAAPEKVRHLVYLAAGLPLEGRTVLEATGGAAQPSGDGDAQVTQLMSDETGMLRFIRPDARGRMECVDREAAGDFFYHDCDEATVAWAFERLTPAPSDFLTETVSIPRFWAADLPRSYIRCAQDRAKPQAMSETVVDRLGVAPLSIDASHSPFLSRPAELAELLVAAVATRPTGPLKPN